jgi:hypothetical protein
MVLRDSEAHVKVIVVSIWLLTLCGAASAQQGTPPGGAIEHLGPLSSDGESIKQPLAQAPALTAAQRDTIFRSVVLDKSASRTSEAPNVAIGELMPPTIELRPLPARAVGEIPTARQYRYALVVDQLVLVDPATMRVVAVIKP